MIEPGQDARLVEEAAARCCIVGGRQPAKRVYVQATPCGAVWEELLDSDGPVGADIAAEVGDPEASLPEHLPDGVDTALELGRRWKRATERACGVPAQRRTTSAARGRPSRVLGIADGAGERRGGHQSVDRVMQRATMAVALSGAPAANARSMSTRAAIW